ncbi:MAG: hypothetical protein ACRES9_09150 [Gammaproteobacteria bacterium]
MIYSAHWFQGHLIRFMLFATTSNGVYCCDVARGQVQRILGNRHSAGLLKAEARGYFGIARHTPTGRVLVASRERSFARFSKLANNVKLHLIDPATLRSTLLASVGNVHDVHQIAWHDGHVFLTDTGKNRIVIYAPGDGSRKAVNAGGVRDDVNHVNVVLVHEEFLYVGLNNRGVEPAALLRLPLSELYASLRNAEEIDITTLAKRIGFDALTYTHDLEPDADGRLFASLSYEGCVFDVADGRRILKVGDWTRGLAFGSRCLWVGTSALAGRKQRHSEKLDGGISLYSLPNLECMGRVVLHKAGQVNDLLYVEDDVQVTSFD